MAASIGPKRPHWFQAVTQKGHFAPTSALSAIGCRAPKPAGTRLGPVPRNEEKLLFQIYDLDPVRLPVAASRWQTRTYFYQPPPTLAELM